MEALITLEAGIPVSAAGIPVFLNPLPAFFPINFLFFLR